MENTTPDFDVPADEAFGACLCPEFANGRRELHVLGQPGCAAEVPDAAAA